MSTGGIPLIYLGDEVGQLNDYAYLNDPSKMDDSRWVNRPTYPAQRYAERFDENTQAGKLYKGFQHLIRLRKNMPELAGGRAVGFYTANKAVLGYIRQGTESMVLCLANFSDYPEWVGKDRFGALPAKVKDLVQDCDIELHESGIELRAQQFVWLRY